MRRRDAVLDPAGDDEPCIVDATGLCMALGYGRRLQTRHVHARATARASTGRATYLSLLFRALRPATSVAQWYRRPGRSDLVSGSSSRQERYLFATRIRPGAFHTFRRTRDRRSLSERPAGACRRPGSSQSAAASEWTATGDCETMRAEEPKAGTARREPKGPEGDGKETPAPAVQRGCWGIQRVT